MSGNTAVESLQVDETLQKQSLETFTCDIPLLHFWYVNQAYKEEIKRIEKESGVKILAEAKLTFEADRKDGSPNHAFSEFIHLVHKVSGESKAFTVPLNKVKLEEWKDTLSIIQRPENNLFLTVSSEEMTICGSRQGQDAIRQSFGTARNTSTVVGESTRASQDTPLTINQPLINAGPTAEEGSRKLVAASYNEEVDESRTQFGVDCKESDVSQGKGKVKPSYQRSGGNLSMMRRLYQKIATSPMSLTQQHGAVGFSGSPKNLTNAHQLEGASGGPPLNTQSEFSLTQYKEATGFSGSLKKQSNAYQLEGACGGAALEEQPGYNIEATTEGVTAGDNQDDKCPICIDTFTNKKQLECKHEFCEECLRLSIRTRGHICPLCRCVFGMMHGDQPGGKMKWDKRSYSLPGFSGCGTIVITYKFSNGRQASRHPNPGEIYYGTTKTAYLPDNKEGNEVLMLLKEAFHRGVIFTIGMNQVIWNDIPHKTSKAGGPKNYGYPDPDYLSRVREELKAKGIE